MHPLMHFHRKQLQKKQLQNFEAGSPVRNGHTSQNAPLASLEQNKKKVSQKKALQKKRQRHAKQQHDDGYNELHSDSVP